jgi:heme exporter protein C
MNERMPAFLKYILFVLMSVVIVMAWITGPPQGTLGGISRIFYFHVPVAWVAVLSFTVAMINSVAYLKTRKIKYDVNSTSAAQLGLTFSILATISGSIFARAAWGSYWNWDPRQTSIFVLLLIYGALLALRSAVDGEQRRAALTSVYSILAFIAMPFLVFIVPRVYESLHPGDTIIGSSGGFQLSGMVLFILITSILSFTLIFFWLQALEVKIITAGRKKNRRR